MARKPPALPSASETSPNLAPAGGSLPRPRWDREARQLWLGDVLLKRYRNRAEACEALLDAFEEEGWPRRIDDPLPPRSGRHEPQRLREQVYALNHGLKKPLIRFYLDGTGEGVCWERV